MSEADHDRALLTGEDGTSPTPIWISPRLHIAIIGAFALLILAVWLVPEILTFVIGGIALALILSFPVRWLSKVMPRGLAILVALLLLLGIIVVALSILLPQLIHQLTGLIAAWPGIQDDLDGMLDDAARQLQAWGLAPDDAATRPDWLREGVTGRIQAVAADLLRGLLDLASGAIGFVIQLVSVVTIAIYLLLDVRTLREWFIGIVPPRYRQDAAALWDAFATSIARYLGGVTVVAAVTGALSCFALWALGVPYPLLLGAWVAFCSFIPVFGTYLGVVPALPLALAESPATAVLTILAYVIIQQVEDNVLTPRVQGETAHVHPLVILLAVLWTGFAFGLFWSILAVPALVVGHVLFDFFRVRLRVRKEHSRGRP